MDWKTGGALAFGLVIGWYVYYVNRYRKGDVQISDITTIIGALGGGAILALFPSGSDLFGGYGVGLAIGFFLYFLSLIILVGKSSNFDSDWFLDGRRKDPVPPYGYGTDGQHPMAPVPGPAGGAIPGQVFYVGAAPAAPAPGAPHAAAAAAPLAAAAGPDPDDPAGPAPGDMDDEDTADFETARFLTNVGSGPVDEEPAAAAVAPAAAGAPATMQIDIARAQDFLHACMTSNPRVTYGLGKKVPFHGAVPGRDFKKVDCSGFVREAIWRATDPHVNFPDGSVVQHDWVKNKGFQRVNVADGGLNDNHVRIAFLRPQDDGPRHIGHVLLLSGGRTLESHGGVGPDSRAWTNLTFRSKLFVYLLK
jgi:hypothetical protein